MTPPPDAARPAARGSAGVTAGVILLGLAATLAVMAGVLLVLGVGQHETTTSLCSNDGTSVGECLLATHENQQQLHLIWLSIQTLGGGAVAALVVSAAAFRLRD